MERRELGSVKPPAEHGIDLRGGRRRHNVFEGDEGNGGNPGVSRADDGADAVLGENGVVRPVRDELLEGPREQACAYGAREALRDELAYPLRGVDPGLGAEDDGVLTVDALDHLAVRHAHGGRIAKNLGDGLAAEQPGPDLEREPGGDVVHHPDGGVGNVLEGLIGLLQRAHVNKKHDPSAVRVTVDEALERTDNVLQLLVVGHVDRLVHMHAEHTVRRVGDARRRRVAV